MNFLFQWFFESTTVLIVNCSPKGCWCWDSSLKKCFRTDICWLICHFSTVASMLQIEGRNYFPKKATNMGMLKIKFALTEPCRVLVALILQQWSCWVTCCDTLEFGLSEHAKYMFGNVYKEILQSYITTTNKARNFQSCHLLSHHRARQFIL